MVRLGVNIDHIATLRQARKTYEPDPVLAVQFCLLGGADGITFHLREDRRHINDRDARLLRECVNIWLNMEMAVTDEMIKLAKEIKPDSCCLVPEKRQEVTTEGGLNVVSSFKKIKRCVSELKECDIKVSLFIDADEKQIEAAINSRADSIEIHTGEYALNYNLKKEHYMKKILKAAELADSYGLAVHAGHGLNYHNIVYLLQHVKLIEEVNIGHSIISRAVFIGLKEAVSQMKALCSINCGG